MQFPPTTQSFANRLMHKLQKSLVDPNFGTIIIRVGPEML